MPRTSRASAGGYCYHVLNRGNARATVFHRESDYATFLGLIGEATRRVPMRLIGYCLMPNHFHLVVWPRGDDELSRWMQWLMTSQTRRHQMASGSSGHIWQGRFKAFPIQEDDHLRTVLRYVERNPLRANLVTRAEDWPWSSLTRSAGPPDLDPGPARRGPGWIEAVNAAMTEAECRRVREAVQRGSPLGDPRWTSATAAKLGIGGRPATARDREAGDWLRSAAEGPVPPTPVDAPRSPSDGRGTGPCAALRSQSPRTRPIRGDRGEIGLR